MIVSWLLRAVAGVLLGKLWRRVTRRRSSAPLPIPRRP